jgi:lysophospholipase L1-like esterase
MKNFFTLKMVFCGVVAVTLPARAAMTTIENFESYSSSSQLASAWAVVAGSPGVGLETSTVCQGAHALRLDYSGAGGAPIANLVMLTFSSNQNWSSGTVFTFTYGGVTNSSDTIYLQLLDQFGRVLGVYQIPGGTLNAPCTVASVDISNGNAFTNAANGTGLQAVRAIRLGVVATADNHAGTVYFDNLMVGDRNVLSILGSSVASGAMASGVYSNLLLNGSYLGGYGAQLTANLATDGWRVVNQSVWGNATANVIGRFYTDEVPVGADEDLIALSLGNEGLPGASNPQAIYNQFFTGITNLIAMSRSNNIIPLLGGQYPRDVYTASEYVYLKNMDLLLNTLNVPSVNFLGATDDGSGHWINNSFINLDVGDTIHPNDAGHHEMFLTIVPSVFDAVKAGKPTPQWGSRASFLRITADPNQDAPLSFTPGLVPHSFTLSFRVRSTATGTVASITLPDSTVHPTVEITATGLAYLGTNGVVNNSGVVATNGAWHEVVVAHQYAGGLTKFYVDGVLAGTVAERLAPVGFVLGGRGSAATRPGSPAQADFENWLVHRSMLNAEEVAAQFQGAFQQASLEIFAPLDDAAFVSGGTATNRAQSLSAAQVNGASANYSSRPSLTPPSNLTESMNATPAVILKWTDPTAAVENASYVERRTASGQWTNLAMLAAHATTYTDTAVGLGTNYQYRVSYLQGALRSDYSPVASVVIAAGLAQMAFPGSGVANIKFFGIPNSNYVVQTTTNLAGPWWPVSTNTAGPNGSWQFSDPHATNRQQYYRVAQP